MGTHGDSCGTHEGFMNNSRDSWTKKFRLVKLGPMMLKFSPGAISFPGFSYPLGHFGPFRAIFDLAIFQRSGWSLFRPFLAGVQG